MYLKYILEQSEDSLLSKFFHLQLDEPTRGDWASKCLQDLDELKISETLDEIREMTHASFLSLIKSRLKENALKYLLEKRKSKGKEIIYPDLEMADYLHPTNEKLSIEENRNLFSIRNRMVHICSNFSKSEVKPTCVCGEIESMKHIYICEILNEKKVQSEVYENIYNGNTRKQIEVFRKFDENLNKYNILKTENQK